jgi:hypothetical protein
MNIAFCSVNSRRGMQGSSLTRLAINDILRSLTFGQCKSDGTRAANQTRTGP